MLLKLNHSKHQQYIEQLPKISQSVNDIEFFYAPASFREILLQETAKAKYRICIVALYLEQDNGGNIILNSLYKVKQQRPKLDICIIVDWHRARRNRIGTAISKTNADWYYRTAKENPNINIPVYGIPVSIREALGVLHLKGFIIDDSILYSGASLNNNYLHQFNKYRYDRYHLIRNVKMTDIMFNWIKKYLIREYGINFLDEENKCKANYKIKNNIYNHHKLHSARYQYQGDANNEQLSVTPLIGLGKNSLLNKTIFHLILCTEHIITICTPYFNFPSILMRNVIKLLKNGKKVEIIVGDKTANDFFIPENQPFKIIGTLPYLYEINLRTFLRRLQYYINNNQLIVRIWKNNNNSYHIKGLWVDNEWILLTGNNFNYRAWRLDLENAILIHDPQQELRVQRELELKIIRTYTYTIQHYNDLQSIADYPVKIRRLVRRLRRIKIDRLINHIL